MEGNLRGLKIAVVAMGVLIVLATAGLIATVIHRATTAADPRAVALPPPAAGNAPVLLDEPAGTRIASIVALRDGLALLLQGGGPDRVVLIDPATGRPAERVGLAR